MRRFLAAAALASTIAPGCASNTPPPAPPPFEGAPPGPPREVGDVEHAAPAAETPSDAPPVAAVPAAPPPPQPTITFEAPFRLDRRIFPKDKQAFLADLADRTRWNQGGLGTPSAPLPPVPGHPAPKVILDVVRVRGGHTAADLQARLRRNFWIKVVECYGLGAYKNQTLRGVTSLSLGVTSSGAVASAKATHTTLADEDVPACLAARLKSMTLSSARAASTVAIDIRIGPGDEPVPPPANLIVPGDGELAPGAIGSVVEAAMPAFDACYRTALAYAPELWGRLGVRFHVTENGKTDEAFEVESRFPDERMTLCVLRAARKLVFPKPAGGDVRFIVPLRFSSGSTGSNGSVGAAKVRAPEP